VTIPLRMRARRTPRRFPLVTIERAIARLCGGARSPTKGNIICGVTVVMAVMKEMAWKIRKSVVTHSPIQRVAVKKIMPSTKYLRRKTSPSGQRNNKPVA
jgi:hypothetical protein